MLEKWAVKGLKGLALNIIFSLVIALVAVILFISLVTGTLQNAAKWFYCDVYFKIVTSFLGQETASIPKMCMPTETPPTVVEIKDQDNKIVSRELLAYIIECWKETEIKQLYKTHPCYELHLMKEVDSVTEQNVSSILINEDHCKSIENSDYDCGSKNQILWDIDGNIIVNQKIILVKYDNSTDAVRVIG
jgi:hypothetical protein